MPFEDDDVDEGTCGWCGIDIDRQQSDVTEDAEMLCLDCYAQYNRDRGLNDEGNPLTCYACGGTPDTCTCTVFATD